MAFGPTQNYDDVSLGVWKGRPILAAAVRTLIAAVPVLLSVGLGLAALHWFPPRRLGVNPWLWLLVELACATLVLVVATRTARRLVPLATLLRLTSYFPDRAPSRLAVAMNHYSPRALQAGSGSRFARRRELRPRDVHAARILNLVAAIGDHEPLTRGHSERVQAYAALIGKELGLSEEDAAKLSWAALLHDVGKLRVPTSVLSKPGQPTAGEWAVLAGHPEAGMQIAGPLREWLGPWLDVIGQHHERWDGGGYPAGLAGESISRGARIVAVADAYDVITSVRSYKKPLSASAARAELARCAGEQFDPQVVRAFLAIGLGRLRRVAGPLGVLSVLPGLPSFAADLPSAVQRLAAAGALQSAGAVGLVLSVTTLTAGGALAGVPSPPAPPIAVPAEQSVTAPGAEGAGGASADLVVAPTSAAAAPDAPEEPRAVDAAQPADEVDEPQAAPAPISVPAPVASTDASGAAPAPTPTPDPDAPAATDDDGNKGKGSKDGQGGNKGKGGGEEDTSG